MLKPSFWGFLHKEVIRDKSLSQLQKALLLFIVLPYSFGIWTWRFTVGRLIGHIRWMQAGAVMILFCEQKTVGEVVGFSWNNYDGEKHAFYVRIISLEEYQQACKEIE